MTKRSYTNPRTGEVTDDPDIRPFDQILRDLGEGSTNHELSEALWDLLQRVQDTGKSGSLSLVITVAADGAGRAAVKDEIKVKLPEYSRTPTAFFIDRQGNATRRDPNQPEIPGVRKLHDDKEAN